MCAAMMNQKYLLFQHHGNNECVAFGSHIILCEHDVSMSSGTLSDTVHQVLIGADHTSMLTEFTEACVVPQRRLYYY